MSTMVFWFKCLHYFWFKLVMWKFRMKIKIKKLNIQKLGFMNYRSDATIIRTTELHIYQTETAGSNKRVVYGVIAVI